MRHLLLRVSYDGTNYHGFQDQGTSGLRTVQGALEDALQRLTGESVRVTGAGRTDAGVHALGQAVGFRTASNIPLERWPYALNAVLPPDIVVWSAVPVDEDFHPRYSAKSKTYRYTIENSRFPSVFWRRFAYHVPQQLDINAMAAAAKLLEGTHDFAAFRSTGSSAITTVRTLQLLQVHAEQGLVHITAQADGFLYNMVRIIAGTLVEIGQGRRSPHQVEAALAGGDRNCAGRTLPPHGLCLLSVAYPDLEVDEAARPPFPAALSR